MKRSVVVGSMAVAGLIIGGCFHATEEEHTSGVEYCADNISQKLKDSSGRTLCVALDEVDGVAPFDITTVRAPGKVQNKAVITDENGDPIDLSSDTVITMVSHYPLMTMNSDTGSCDGMQHSTPVVAMADDTNANIGEFGLTTYYVMASMMGEMTMGCWEYRVMLHDSGADEPLIANFEDIDIMGQQGTNAFTAPVKNADDKWKNHMGDTTSRRYRVWLDSFAAGETTGEYTVKLVVSTEDLDPSAGTMDMSGMDGMSKISARHGDEIELAMDHQTYPMVGTSLSLHDEMGMDKAINSISLSVSMTGDGTDWQAMDEVSMMGSVMAGSYTTTLAGITSGDSVTLYFQLTVNDTVMTSDGSAEIDTTAATAEAPANLGKLSFTAP